MLWLDVVVRVVVRSRIKIYVNNILGIFRIEIDVFLFYINIS